MRGTIKVVGKRKRPQTLEECLLAAEKMIAELELLNPFPRPRGFIFKAKTREEYESWKKEQENPWLW